MFLNHRRASGNIWHFGEIWPLLTSGADWKCNFSRKFCHFLYFHVSAPHNFMSSLRSKRKTSLTIHPNHQFSSVHLNFSTQCAFVYIAPSCSPIVGFLSLAFRLTCARPGVWATFARPGGGGGRRMTAPPENSKLRTIATSGKRGWIGRGKFYKKTLRSFFHQVKFEVTGVKKGQIFSKSGYFRRK